MTTPDPTPLAAPIYCTGGCDVCRDYARELGVPIIVSPAPDAAHPGDAATILGIVLSTSVLSDKHPEDCIEAARPMLAHLANLGWTLSPRPAPDATLRDRIMAVLLMGDGGTIPRDHVAALLNDLDDEAFAVALATPEPADHD